jgi:hypothetical protein
VSGVFVAVIGHDDPLRRQLGFEDGFNLKFQGRIFHEARQLRQFIA